MDSDDSKINYNSANRMHNSPGNFEDGKQINSKLTPLLVIRSFEIISRYFNKMIIK